MGADRNIAQVSTEEIVAHASAANYSVTLHKNTRSYTKYGVSAAGGMPAVILAGKPTTPSGVTPAFFVLSDDCARRRVQRPTAAKRRHLGRRTASSGRVQKPTERSEALGLLEKFVRRFATLHILAGKYRSRVPNAADVHSDLFSTYSSRG